MKDEAITIISKKQYMFILGIFCIVMGGFIYNGLLISDFPVMLLIIGSMLLGLSVGDKK